MIINWATSQVIYIALICLRVFLPIYRVPQTTPLRLNHKMQWKSIHPSPPLMLWGKPTLSVLLFSEKRSANIKKWVFGKSRHRVYDKGWHYCPGMWLVILKFTIREINDPIPDLQRFWIRYVCTLLLLLIFSAQAACWGPLLYGKQILLHDRQTIASARYHWNDLWTYLDDPEGLPHPAHTYWMLLRRSSLH